MIRLVIITAAAILALAGASAALSHARHQDPGPAIVLSAAPADDGEAPAGAGTHRDGGDTGGKDAASAGSGGPGGGGAGSTQGHDSDKATFTITQPRPIKADDPGRPTDDRASDEPGDSDKATEPDDDSDEPDEADEADEELDPDDAPRD